MSSATKLPLLTDYVRTGGFEESNLSTRADGPSVLYCSTG